MGEEGSWDQTIQEWIVDTGYAYAGALAQKEDGAFFAAAPVAGEAGWGFVFMEDHEVDVTQEDGETVKKETINEPTSLKYVVDNCKATPSGLWLGGQKYRVVTGEPKFESGDYTFTQIFAAGTKKGVHISGTSTMIVAGFYDEEKGQTSGNCKKVVVAFAEYLASIGY
mmetsp:Transcript_29751/g.69174  ORF Transcript_29751/g.69174 Transcript_29751/m.69174 type:complete len:168 (+) Transcript_29751:84-587(+)